MGKIKSKMIKRSANMLISKGVETSEDFNENKKMLQDSMPSKKVRNQLAGFLVREKKKEKAKQEKLLITKSKSP